MGLHAVVVAVTAAVPRVLVVRSAAGIALPFGPLDPDADRTLERGLRRYVVNQTGLEVGYVEQLYTFGDRDREGDVDGSRRTLSVAYLALVREGRLPAGGAAGWSDVYRHLPWEDRRAEPPAAAAGLTQDLQAWAGAEPARRERMEIAFGAGGSSWDGGRVLDRYELLWEAGLVTEGGGGADTGAGAPLVGDHRRILATALGRLRGKLSYRPVVFELLPPTFTLLALQQVVEALVGVRLHKPNFRRVVATGGLVERTGHRVEGGRGRPAERYRFRREVLRERPAPGVGLPAARLPPGRA